MNKKKELTVNDMKRISNTDENPKRVHKKPTSFEEAVSLMINYLITIGLTVLVVQLIQRNSILNKVLFGK